MLCVVLQLFVAYGVLAEVSLPQFPPSLEINYFTIAHQISEHQEYPLRQRDYKLLYDKNYGAARFEYEDENGFNIILIRNYHQHYEVRIESLNGTDICEYSYLGQHFPNPTYPSKYDYNGVKSEGENRLLSFSTQIYRQYFDIYFEEVTKLPIRVDEYWINEENRPVPIFSTIYRHIERKESDPWLFDEGFGSLLTEQ